MKSKVSFGFLAVVLLLSVAARAEEKSVPIVSTDELQAQLKSNAKQLQLMARDLATINAAKQKLFDECLTAYNSDPSQANFAKVYAVHFAITKDEATVLCKVAELATDLGFGINEDRQRKEQFRAKKQRDLIDVMNNLAAMKDRYQTLTTQLSVPNLPAAEKERFQRQRDALVRVMEEQWTLRTEIERSLARVQDGVARANDDAKALGLLAQEILSRRNARVFRLQADSE